MPDSPIFLVTGAPAVGKSTFCRALMARFTRGIHVPIDDLREWVVAGRADPFPWTDETSRQFLLAEDSACDLARRYADAGFAVALDHCSRTLAFDALIKRNLSDRRVMKILLLASPDVNLTRNQERTHKPFPPDVLVPTIHGLNEWYREHREEMENWVIVPNDGSVEEAVDAVMAHLASLPKSGV